MSLADKKTEVLIMKGPRNREGLKIKPECKVLAVKKEIKYFGVWLNQQIYFSKHVIETQKKAKR